MPRLIEGLLKLFYTEKIYEPVNIGNPLPIPMTELAQEVIDLVGSKSKIVNLPLPGDDPKQREPDISKARILLGWEPTINRKIGLRNTIEYFKRILEI